MRLSSSMLSFVGSFLLGISWAWLFLGAFFAFNFFLPMHFILALLAGVFGAIPGMIAILLLEHIFTTQAHYREAKKQTKLLEALLAKQESSELR